ncbi:MAG: twin-arginine translocase TatA/TatE family subunit [Pseudobdellovibrio sp.]
MSFTHMIILAIIAVIVIPPEKLPDVARQVARFINDLRRSTTGVWDGLKKDTAFNPAEIMKPTIPVQPNDNIPPNQVVPNPEVGSDITVEETKKHE